MVEDIQMLSGTIEKYEDIAKCMRSNLSSNNSEFCRRFGAIVDDLINN